MPNLPLFILGGLYCGILLLTSSFYEGGLAFLLFGFTYFLLGPALFMMATVALVPQIKKRPFQAGRFVVPVATLILVMGWTFGYRTIARITRPFVYRLVAADNERLAAAFLRDHPLEDAEISGFRYPYFPLGGGIKLRVTHDYGNVCVCMPSGASHFDILIYVPRDSKPPENVEQIAESWYYDQQ